MGENGAVIPVGRTPTDAVNNWWSERVDYNIRANTCSGICNHYTQVFFTVDPYQYISYHIFQLIMININNSGNILVNNANDINPH